MKKTIILSLLILTACNTGNVQVGSGATSPQTGTAGTTQGSSNGNGGSSGNQQPGTSLPGSSGKIFFERVRVSGGIPQFLLAISFSSINAKNSSSFGVSLLGNQLFSASAPFSPEKNELVYLRSVDVGTDALLSTSLESLDANQFFSFPREVVDYSLNSDHSMVAWVDQVGLVTVSNTQNGTSTTYDSTAVGSNTVLTHVQWAGDNAHLLARADNGKALLYKSATDKPTLLTGVNASSFSADGTQLAYFNSLAKALHFYDLASDKDNVAGTFESSEIHDLTWNSATSVSYWTVLASGAKELRVFDGSKEIDVAALTLPSSIQDGVVCPAWVGNKVYFGNYDSGKYVIEQIDLNKDAKKATGMQIYAETPDADLGEGFLCPKVVK